MSEKSRGRPKLPEGERKGWNTMLRLRNDLRERIAKAAEDNGCSLNAEVGRRLIESFEREDLDSAIRKAVREALDEHRI